MIQDVYKAQANEGLERGGAKLLVDLPFSDKKGDDIVGSLSCYVHERSYPQASP